MTFVLAPSPSARALSVSRRDLLGGMTLCVAAGLPRASCAESVRPSDEEYVARWVLPELRPMARAMLQQAGREPALSLATLAVRRRLLAAPTTMPAFSLPVERRVAPGLKGEPDVTVFVVNAQIGARRPVVVNMHGGGLVAGAAAAGLPALVALCRELDCAAVTIEYRLAPEVDHEGSTSDTYAALLWIHRNCETLGVDPGRIAVMGDSAGGCHAALLAIQARDRGEVPLAFQCLVYPMLDDRTGSTRPTPSHVGRLVWNEADNRFGWRSFLGVAPGRAKAPARAVPARTADLAGLPPTFIGVGSLDLFHDEDVDYARRLNASGVPTELIVVPGAFHVFDLMPTAISRWFNAAKVEALRRAFAPPLRTG